MAVAAPTETASLAARLGGVHVGLRDDLETSRHLFHGEPSYVIRDPLTSRTHRFDAADYRVLVHIDASRTLRDVFSDLTSREVLHEEDEDAFFEFVVSLHRAGLLNLPLADGRPLYRRLQAKNEARRRRRFSSLIYFQRPLWNPDAFLGKTVKYVRPLFSQAFGMLWLLLMVVAATIVVARGRELAEPLQGLLAAGNLPLMWLTLIALKTVHEFGHAYACKHYGLHVPEMGIYFIVGTPCAYVDASAAWGLSQPWRRILIGLAGMYVESFVAASALIVWACTGPSLVNSLAYNVAFLASVVTIVFNINPLMRFDGYYVLSDLLGAPNLGRRASDYVLRTLKRLTLGVAPADDAPPAKPRWLLFAYGVSAPVYRLLILVAIASLLASRFYLLGLAVGVIYVGIIIGTAAVKATRYLWFSEETASVRPRAVALSAVLLIVLPVVLALTPIRSAVRADGVVAPCDEVVVRAEAPGFLEAVHAREGEIVDADAPLVTLRNDDLAAAVDESKARLKTATILRDAYHALEPGKAVEEQQRVRAFADRVRRQEELAASLTLMAPRACRVVSGPGPTDLGRFFGPGAEIARLADDERLVRVLLSQDDFASAAPAVGQLVEFLPANGADQPLTGVVQRVAPAGDRSVRVEALTLAAGGDIPVSPQTGQALQPYFLVDVRLASQSTPLAPGVTGRVRFNAAYEPIGLSFYRRVARFLNALARD